MTATRRRAAAVLLVAFAVLLAGLAPQGVIGLSRRGVQAAAEPTIAAGPTGRVELRSWIERGDPGDRGLARGWSKGGFGGRRVTVPDDVDPRDWQGRRGSANLEGSIAWYRTQLVAERSATYALSFQSANFAASVWVDGRPLGEHRGSYLPFELRARLATGSHTLVVRVDWRDPSRQALEGFHRTWFNWGGLDGEVEARPIGDSELLAPTLETRLARSGAATVTVGVQVRNHGSARTVLPEGSLEGAGQTIPLAFAPVELGAGAAATVSATAQLARPQLWSPSHPNLYRLSIAVAGESGYHARVGLREITWSRGRIFLNGRRLVLHGATVQEDSASRGDVLDAGEQDAIVRELRAIGANAIRAQHPLDPALLERLDAAGILDWQGVGPVEGAGNWHSNTPRQLSDAEQRARTAIVADRLHPSVIAWNLVDEIAHNGKNGAEVRYVEDLERWIHAHDPTRMAAIDVWGDHPPQTPGAVYRQADAVAETDYAGWYDHPGASAARLRAEIRGRLSAMERTFAGKVLLVSEFGAESNGLNPSSSPGGYDYQARLLGTHLSVYAADARLSGFLIWLLRDYALTPTFEGGSVRALLPHLRLIEGLNQKGLFTRSGRAKPAVATVRRLFGALSQD